MAKAVFRARSSHKTAGDKGKIDGETAGGRKQEAGSRRQ